jgi:predicted deacylase
MKTISIGNVAGTPGGKVRGYVDLAAQPDGSDLRIPVCIAQGHEDGPTLGIVGGVHGDEYEGREALLRVFEAVEPKLLRGALVGIPTANLPAFQAMSRVGNIDYLDLNRSFPGGPDGFVTQRIAHFLTCTFLPKVDYLLDLHSAGLNYALLPYVGYVNTEDDLGRDSLALAKAFGIKHLYGSSPFSNVFRLEARKQGIPSLLVEVKGEGRCLESEVGLIETGIQNVMKHLGMMDGQFEGLPESYTFIEAGPEGEFLHADTGGFLRSMVALGDTVREGQLLGTITGPLGEPRSEIRAPHDGIVMDYRTLPVTRLGEWTFFIANLVREEPSA